MANKKNSNNNTESNNTNMTNQLTEYQQMRTLMSSPKFKRAIKEAEKYMVQKKVELEHERGLLNIHREAYGNAMLGRPEYRDKSIVKVVDGTILRVDTDSMSSIKSIATINNFEELSTAERTELYTNNKKLYKMLQLNLYKPNTTDKIVDLICLEDSQYEYFDIIASYPSKPNTDNYKLGESCDVLRQYENEKAIVDSRLQRYMQDLEAFKTGIISQNIDASEEKIKQLEAELRGDV